MKHAPLQAQPDGIFLLVFDYQRREQASPAVDGWLITKAKRNRGIGHKASGGGACVCAGCQVYVDRPWTERLYPPTSEEVDRLDEAFGRKPSSHLCCQILMSSEISGLRVRPVPGSEAE